MGRIYRSLDDEEYGYISDNKVVYDIYEGKCMGNDLTSDIIYIMINDPEADDLEFVGWTYGATLMNVKSDREEVTRWIDEIVNVYEKQNKDQIKRLGRTMPSDLRQMLKTLSDITQCGGIRSYYDAAVHAKDNEYGYYDSALVFNLMACCEEVADCLLEEDVDGAEALIKNFKGEN